MLDKNSPIGVFDSGIGGLSVMRALRDALPHEQFVYFADTANAPYGEKGDAFVRQRSLAITQQLRSEHGIKALVVACNTATAAAIEVLRGLHPDLTIIGIEPALKPAAAQSSSKQVAVFATQGTLASHKFHDLRASLKNTAQFSCIACDGLAETIELHFHDLNAAAILQKIKYYTDQAGLHKADCLVDTVVLGCTHYPLVESLFRQCLPASVTVIDNSAGLTKRLIHTLSIVSLLATEKSNNESVVFLSSSVDQTLCKRMQSLFQSLVRA